jgi:hypothetical protein
MPRDRHKEFDCLLNAIEASVSAGGVIYVIFDICDTPKNIGV